MIQLISPQTFEFFATYLLAGYVVIFVRSAYVSGLRPKPTELLIEAIILSLIVQFIVLLFAGLHGWLVARPWMEWLWEWIKVPPDTLALVVKILLAPGLLGIVLGRFLQSGWRNNLLRRFSLPVVHPVRRAHDFAFGNDRAPGLVEITYEDGTKVGGWFGEKSLAASDEDRSDLYLERVYIIDDGDWRETIPPRSMLLNLANVRFVEFLEEEENTGNDQ